MSQSKKLLLLEFKDLYKKHFFSFEKSTTFIFLKIIHRDFLNINKLF